MMVSVCVVVRAVIRRCKRSGAFIGIPNSSASERLRLYRVKSTKSFMPDCLSDDT
jgi:hypothetical protein